jgi:hypothetical protein
MTGTSSPEQGSPPKSRAAFSRDDVPDAKRGYPDFDLRSFAQRRGLEWLDHATAAGYRAALPGKDELQSNVVRGVLPGGEYGVLAHEGLEIRYSGDSFDWGGGYYGVKVIATGVGLRGLLPFSGRVNEAQVRVPCSVAGVRLPESVGTYPRLRIDTRRSASPLPSGHRFKLNDLLGFRGWSVWSEPELSPDALAAILGDPVRMLITNHAEDGLFQIAVWWGTLLVRRNGYLREEGLVELGEAASLLAGRLREVFLAQSQPLPFTAELAPPTIRDPRDPARIFNQSPVWIEWSKQTAERHGMELEDPFDYHRAFPSVPVPGQAAVVMRGTLPGVGDCRLAVHRERDSSRCALLVPGPPGTEPTPAGGMALGEPRVRLETGGGLRAVWGMNSYWGSAMAGDVDEFIAGATTALQSSAAPPD